MPRHAEIRRSFAASSFGPGSVVDLRVDQAPVSVVMAGLEVWEERGGTASDQENRTVREPRLARRLGVRRFVLPPVALSEDQIGPATAGVRFPEWLQCPLCHRVRPLRKWGSDLGGVGRFCAPCTASMPGHRKVWVLPVRFILACSRGHLDDFPWDWWVQHRGDCSNHDSLRLETIGAGLAGLRLRCESCGQQRSMDGIFGGSAMQGISCKGLRPWIPGGPEGCQEPVRVTQRGASNLYFAIVDSALSIPPYADHMVAILGEFWEALQNCEAQGRALFLDTIWAQIGGRGFTKAQILDAVVRIEAALGEAEVGADLRPEEYAVLSSPHAVGRSQDEFALRPGDPEGPGAELLARVSRVVRLREVRALRGFTRLSPPSGDFAHDGTMAAPLSAAPRDWLPAMEVRGEAVFVSLDADRLMAWEAQAVVRNRTAAIDREHQISFLERYGGEAVARRIPLTPRFVLLHSFAHALLRYLALDCGYSSASLRERIYAGRERDPLGMAGVLIYTATTDADGTLGGLARQGRPQRFAEVLQGAIRDLEWCSSDPLCMEGMTSLSGGLSGAACHGCLMAAETSCEHFNRFLDRQFLVGTPDDRALGYFSVLLG